MSEPGSLIRALTGRQPARNFHSYVISEVGLAIVSGRMPVGSILPGDSEMIERFGVSRTVLREALKTLEAKGLVEARAKVGTRVLPQSRWSLFDRQVLSWVLEAGPSPALTASFHTIRSGLEIEAAGLAARHREGEHLRLLQYWLTQRRMMTTQPELFGLAEFEIHRIVAEASNNPFLRAANALSEFGVALSVRVRLGADGSAPPEGLAARHDADFARLAAAIDAGDVTAARETMSRLVQTTTADDGTTSA